MHSSVTAATGECRRANSTPSWRAIGNQHKIAAAVARRKGGATLITTMNYTSRHGNSR